MPASPPLPPADSPRPVRFVHRGEVVEVVPSSPVRTVLEWLREDRRATGTKEGCAEGDCGACTVAVASLDADGRLQVLPANACIQFLPMLDGRALFTVEDLSAPGGALHPVQQSLVDHHASQCGFCTPGFVMSLWAGREAQRLAMTDGGDVVGPAAADVPAAAVAPVGVVDAAVVAAEAPAVPAAPSLPPPAAPTGVAAPTRQALADLLAGNLCRCTGYRPILDAAEAVFAQPPAAASPLDAAQTAALARTLQGLQRDAPLALPGFAAPTSLDGLADALQAAPGARVLAGATDLGLWVTKQLRAMPPLVSVQAVAELQRIERDDAVLRIGAAVSLEGAWRALVADWPALHDLWLRFASPPIRHAGTLGANVANGSPIGDGAPALMALGTVLVLRRGPRVRRLPLDAFYLGYQRNALEDSEFLQAMEVPRPAAVPGRVLRAYKVSKRFDSDISAVCGAFALTLDGAGRVAEARLAWGGLAATVARAPRAEAALAGRTWDAAALADAQAALDADFTPLTDMRASSAYRRQVARNLLHRLWLATRTADPLPDARLSVFDRGAVVDDDAMRD